MIATTANAQPAAAAYHRDHNGLHRAFGLGVLSVTSAGITRILAFGEPDLVPKFRLPHVHPGALTPTPTSARV